MGKYYAVKVGKKPGIYNSWDECKEQVNGYSGAVFKSFKTREEAVEFIGGDLQKELQEDFANEHIVVNNDKHIIAYVDGSYNDAEKRVGMGIVIFDGDEVIEISKEVEAGDLISMRNVAGEIKAAEEAMRYAVSHKADRLDIYHDYKGIACWCSGEWKANLQGTKAYREYYKSIEGIEINFIKVKAHSGDKYNEICDRLAKKACGI